MNSVEIPAETASNFKRYDHHSPAEIITLLTRVVRAHAAVCIQGGGHQLSAIVDSVHITQPHLLMKCDADSKRLDEALSCENLLFSVEVGAARLEFTIPSQGIPSVRDDSMIVVPLPTRMLRFDRREHLRIAITETKPVTCELNLADGNKLVCDAYDLSLGGIGLTVSRTMAVLTSGMTFSGSRLVLQRDSPLRVDIEIRHRVEESLTGGGSIIGLGCRFRNLSEQNSRVIQEFVRGYELMPGLELGNLALQH